MKDWEISGKLWNLCCFERISFAILYFGLFSGSVTSSQASQFAKRNFKCKQIRTTITSKITFLQFIHDGHAMKWERKSEGWNEPPNLWDHKMAQGKKAQVS